MEPKVWVESITFSDDTTIEIAKDDVVVIVGPNNSGQSATLRAIRDKFAIPLTPSPVVKKMTLDRGGHD